MRMTKCAVMILARTSAVQWTEGASSSWLPFQIGPDVVEVRNGVALELEGGLFISDRLKPKRELKIEAVSFEK